MQRTTGNIRISKLIPDHTCFCTQLFPRATCNSLSWLHRHIQKHLNVSKRTAPSEIIDSVQIHYGEQVNSQAAHQVCASLAHNELDYKHIAFQQLPAYIY